jgi:hypothetical protein
MHVFLVSTMRATCPYHLILLDLITPIIFLKYANYEAAQNEVFFSLPPLSPS